MHSLQQCIKIIAVFGAKFKGYIFVQSSVIN